MRFLMVLLLLLVYPAAAFAVAPGDKVTYVTGGTARSGTLLVQTPSLDLVARDGTVSTQDQVAPSVVKPVATATPTSTSTPTPTPTETPTPTPESTPTSGFPDASNTGVPAGTTLTAYTGSSSITTAGTVIDGKTLGCLEIRAANVTIRNSRITCNGSAIYVEDTGTASPSLLLEDSEVSCGGTGTSIGEANVTVRRADIHGCENGFDMNQNMDVQDSYVHGLALGGHEDGIQFAWGHYENGVIVTGSRNIRIVHNTIYGASDSGTQGTSAIITNHGGDRDVVIQGNQLGGGAYTLYCEQGATGINYRVVDNAFRSAVFPPAFGYSTDCSDEVQSGNYILETGQPVGLG